MFIGYSDEEEVRFLEIYDAWRQGLVDASENETYTAESFGFWVGWVKLIVNNPKFSYDINELSDGT